MRQLEARAGDTTKRALLLVDVMELAFLMACMPVDTHAHASEDQHLGAGMTSMLHADRGHAHAEHAHIY